MTALCNPFDIAPLEDDLRHRRALLLVIDNQLSAFPKFWDNMKHYHDVLPKFIPLAENYIDVVHVICPFGEPDKYHNGKNPKLYDAKNLKILAQIREGKEDTCFKTDFLHGFDPRSDRYFAKNLMSALHDGVLEEFINNGKYGTVLVAGIAIRACINETLTDVLHLRERSEYLRNIAIISDLTNNASNSSWESDDDMLKQHLVVKEQLKERGDKISYVTAQEVLSTFHPDLDVDLPLVTNQRIVSDSKKATGYQPEYSFNPIISGRALRY